MDTSNSIFEGKHFVVTDLLQSSEEADVALAHRTEEVMKKILSSLDPILRYVCSPITYVLPRDAVAGCHIGPRMARAVFIYTLGGNSQLLLDDGGNFFSAYKIEDGMNTCKLLREHYHGYISADWREFPFDSIIAGLNSVLKKAEEKRAAHLQSIRERSELLDAVERLFEGK